MSTLSALLWRVFDPLLLKIRSRIEHLDEISPTVRHAMAFREIAKCDPMAKFHLGARINNSGPPNNIQIGAYSDVWGTLWTRTPEAKLHLGRSTFVGSGSNIWAQESIFVGDHVLIAHLVDIHDSDAHSLDCELRHQDSINTFEKGLRIDYSKVLCKAVIIENDVWIGFKSSILKGVHIGKGAVVAAGSVVTKNVAPYTLVAGNPAVVIQTLKSGD